VTYYSHRIKCCYIVIASDQRERGNLAVLTCAIARLLVASLATTLVGLPRTLRLGSGQALRVLAMTDRCKGYGVYLCAWADVDVIAGSNRPVFPTRCGHCGRPQAAAPHRWARGSRRRRGRSRDEPAVVVRGRRACNCVRPMPPSACRGPLLRPWLFRVTSGGCRRAESLFRECICSRHSLGPPGRSQPGPYTRNTYRN
jgi:hypothetical protein